MDESEKRPDIDHRIALEARDWLVRLTSGNASDAELQRFKAWRDLSSENGRAFERERALWQQLQVLDGRSSGMPPFRPPQPVRQPALGRRAFMLGGGGIAVAAVAGVTVPRLHMWLAADHWTGVGEQAAFTLPDGTVATLNTDSAIGVDFRPELRLVNLLKGEAEFRVSGQDASPFRVATLGGNSDCRDATFDVKNIDGMATVTVSDGDVRVSAPAEPDAATSSSAQSVVVSVESQTTYVAGQPPLPASAADISAVLAWRSGRVVFEGRRFGAAIAELGRYLPERIVLAPGVDTSVPISAIFSTREALGAVEALARTQGLSARRIPGVVILIS